MHNFRGVRVGNQELNYGQCEGRYQTCYEGYELVNEMVQNKSKQIWASDVCPGADVKWNKKEGLKISDSKLTYLGVKINKDPFKLFQDNIYPIIEKIRKELNQWKDLPLSMFSRVNLLKMISVQKLLYPLQRLPSS